MSFRKLPKTPTLGGKVSWEDKYELDGWRIQYNKTLDAKSPLKPYRLLDKNNVLVACGDTVEDLLNTLPQLIQDNETDFTKFYSQSDFLSKIDYVLSV